MRSLPVLLSVALFAVGCGNNVVSSTNSGSTAGSTTTGGSTGAASSSGSTGTSATTAAGSTSASSGATGSSTSTTTTGTTGSLPRPTYPSGTGAITINNVITNYSFTGYVAANSGVQINTVTTFQSFDLQQVRNMVDANGHPYTYLLLDLAAGWCVPCNDEAEEFGLNGTDSTKVGTWLAHGGLYVTVMVQNYDENNPALPVHADVDQWLGDHAVQSGLAGDLDGYVTGIPQSAFPANLVINLDTMVIEDAWYGLDDTKISSSWEAKLGIH